jgi:hypothetical protein
VQQCLTSGYLWNTGVVVARADGAGAAGCRGAARDQRAPGPDPALSRRRTMKRRRSTRPTRSCPGRASPGRSWARPARAFRQ